MKCRKCDVDKAATDFYPRCKTCKQCTIARVSAYQKGAGLEVHRRANKKYMASEKGLAVAARAEQVYAPNNQKKIRAKNDVRRAIKMGLIVRRPCEICGAEKTHAHHDDYNYPLKVRFLCPIHHREWHAEHGEAANAE